MMRPLTGFVLMLPLAICIAAQPTGFNYQGSLSNGGSPANGNHDFEFAVFDAVAAGSQLGTTLTRSNVSVANAVFAVSLDFGNVFPGPNRFLEIRVRTSGGGSFTTLTPRQPINSAPYSVKSLNADSATNSSQLGGVSAGQYVLTTDTRMTDARNPLPGSTSYIQNQSASPQASSSFNISGSGTVGGTLSGNVVSASLQYNLAGSRIIGTPGSQNLFIGTFAGPSSAIAGGRNTYVGHSAGTNLLQTTASGNSYFGAGAGAANTTGFSNSMFGDSAGFQNTASNNSFFGASAGNQNSSGTNNAFFGFSAGSANTSASSNSFFGANSGSSNMTGANNAFFGASSGQDNVDGTDNSFFGVNTGRANSSGSNNSYFGRLAGRNTNTGSNNTMVGLSAGTSNNSGSSLTIIGANADVASNNLSFATALGAGAVVSSNNTVQLGRSTDSVNIPGKLKVVILGSAGATPLCRNATAEIGTCSAPLQSPAIIDLQTQIEELSKRIQEQDTENRKLSERIDVLMKLVCRSNTQPEICKEER